MGDSSNPDVGLFAAEALDAGVLLCLGPPCGAI